jgi:hypothetical protein
MTTNQIIPISGHKLSMVQGVYVIAQNGKTAAVCTSLKLVHEWLDGAEYDEASKISIALASLDGMEADDITHVIADDLMGDYRTYSDFSEDQGYALPWLEFWFDEIKAGEFVRDLKSRRDRHRAIHAPIARAESPQAFAVAAE